MTIYYSPSLKGFYNTDVNIGDTGPDFIEISFELYVSLLDGQSAGKVIGLDSNGKPSLIDKPAPVAEELERMEKSKLQSFSRAAANQKSALINRIGVIADAIKFGEASPEEIAEFDYRENQLTEWKRYAVDLGRVVKQPGWYESINWPKEPEHGIDLDTHAREGSV